MLNFKLHLFNRDNNNRETCMGLSVICISSAHPCHLYIFHLLVFVFYSVVIWETSWYIKNIKLQSIKYLSQSVTCLLVMLMLYFWYFIYGMFMFVFMSYLWLCLSHVYIYNFLAIPEISRSSHIKIFFFIMSASQIILTMFHSKIIQHSIQFGTQHEARI